MAAASSPCGPPNCSSIRLASPGLHSATRTVYCSRLLCMNMWRASCRKIAVTEVDVADVRAAAEGWESGERIRPRMSGLDGIGCQRPGRWDGFGPAFLLPSLVDAPSAAQRLEYADLILNQHCI